MKSVLLVLSVAGGCLLSAAEVSLTEFPATVSRAFWTWNGTGLPLANRNLSGGTILIGGTRFPYGICGHTPFSNIYELNGSVDSFSAEIGVEATDHPKDPIQPGDPIPQVTFQFFADFREIFRKRCALGDSPFPVRFDLTGIRHFEIRAKASGGRTSHRCRTAIGNPVFHTAAPQRLKQVLREQAGWRMEPVSYPAAPEWKNIRIEKIRYGNYSGAYRIRTASYELAASSAGTSSAGRSRSGNCAVYRFVSGERSDRHAFPAEPGTWDSRRIPLPYFAGYGRSDRFDPE